MYGFPIFGFYEMEYSVNHILYFNFSKTEYLLETSKSNLYLIIYIYVLFLLSELLNS